MEREGVAADFTVSLPRDLPVADMDLCALLGNALDNAIEGSRGAGERRITIRCKADKGLFMLRVENTLGGAVQPDLATTKTDKAAHGFGIPGMPGNRRALRRHPGRRGPGQRVRAGGVPAPGRAGRNTVNPHALTAAADTGESSIFHICRCVCTEKQGGRPMDGLPAPQPKRTQSIFKSSICSPEGPVKNQFSNPPKVLGITHFSAVWKVSTPAARRSAAAWSTSST